MINKLIIIDSNKKRSDNLKNIIGSLVNKIESINDWSTDDDLVIKINNIYEENSNNSISWLTAHDRDISDIQVDRFFSNVLRYSGNPEDDSILKLMHGNEYELDSWKKYFESNSLVSFKNIELSKLDVLRHDLDWIIKYLSNQKIYKEEFEGFISGKIDEIPKFLKNIVDLSKLIEPHFQLQSNNFTDIDSPKITEIKILVIDDEVGDEYSGFEKWISSQFKSFNLLKNQYSIKPFFVNAWDEKFQQHTVEKAISEIERINPDGIFLDMIFKSNIEKELGIDILKRLKKLNGDYNEKVVVLSTKADDFDFRKKLVGLCFSGVIKYEDAEFSNNLVEFIESLTIAPSKENKSTLIESSEFHPIISNNAAKLTKENILSSFKNHRQRFWHDELDFLHQAINLTYDEHDEGLDRVKAAKLLKGKGGLSTNDFDRWFRKTWAGMDSEHQQKALNEMRLLKKIQAELKLGSSNTQTYEKAKVGTTYYDPNNPEKTWTAGKRGQIPKWLKALLDAGYKLSDLEVKD